MQAKRMFTWVLVVMHLLIVLIMLPVLPAEVPMHFGFGGNITRFGSKYEMLILPALTIIMGLTFPLMERSVIKHDGEKGVRNAKVLYWTNNTITLIFMTLTIMIAYLSYTESTGIDDGIGAMRIVAVCIGISCIVIGNLLPKCKQNALIGIRTKWTLSSETSWYKTHRLGGKAMVIYGVLIVLLNLIILDGSVSLLVTAGGLLIVMIPLIIYSHYVYKKEIR